MERSLEQRYAIKFCVRLRKNATERFQMLQKAFKDDCISRSQSGKWHKAFKEGREEVADEPRSGRPTTARTDENVDRVLEGLRTDRRLSIQQIADTLHMSTFVVNRIVTEDLQMLKVCAKLVPKVLTQDQKELRVLRCQELLDLIQNEPGFLNSVVTGDESWMFEYDPESKRQNCAWHTKSSPRPKKARMSKSRIKTMIIVFLDIRGIVHCEFVPQGQTVNSAFYLEVLRRLKRRIARVRTDIKDTVKLHHDNATSYTAFIITNFLARSNTPVIPHPPNSPDLAPCDFFLFPANASPQIVTGEQRWIYLRNPDTRRQWLPCDQEAKPVVKLDGFGHEVMMSVWWNIDGIAHYELVPDGLAVNADLYLEQLSRVYEVLKTRCPALINRKRVLLQHDNVPTHRAMLATNRIKDLDGIEVLSHPINMKIILSAINLK
ncbi:hypothetical protein LAZ67_6003646, partial [Cordylochernes scorpioides]